MTFPAKEPAALRETIVDAPLASEAVVLALAIVPVDILDALIAVKPPPAPLTVVNVPTLAVKDPSASLATIVEAPLAEAAVVLALAIVPDVILLALIAVKDTPLPDILVNVPVVPVITLPAKEPLASLRTMVEAPLAVAAVVRALAIVPLDMFEALIAEIEAPPPMKLVAVIAFAVKFPEASRATMVLAPLADAAVVAELGILVKPEPEPVNEAPVIAPALNSPDVPRSTIVLAPFAVAAVVRAFAMVPLDILLALMLVRAAPFPDIAPLNVVAVIVLALKLPPASRATIVEAPLAEAAEVLALSKVPVVIAVALIAVIAEPLPEKDAPVIAPAANSPEAPRRTIVEAPLAVAAVVLAFAIVPEAMLEALIFEPPDRLPITAAVTVLALKLPPESR
jgi:hypothetical protein